jgi:hypothetical protein
MDVIVCLLLVEAQRFHRFAQWQNHHVAVVLVVDFIMRVMEVAEVDVG